MNESITEAIDSRRLHHQLAPMELLYETNFDMSIVNELNQKYGHKIVENKPDGGFAAVVGISKEGKVVEGAVDPRRGGSIEIF